MFTDMVGFTRLAQANEALSLKLLEEQRAILRRVFASYGGIEVKTMGDAFLVEFPSALDATRCAVAVQSAVRERNASAVGGEPIRLRIGIHLGDVVGHGSDILGDAVNVASRIEPLAEAGGLCVSEAVFQQVRNKLENAMESLGPQVLKNVDVPLAVYKVVIAPSDRSAVAARPSKPELASAGDPHRLLVLPIRDLSPAGGEYFSDGLTEELISTLGRAAGFRVISRTSAMRYRQSEKPLPEIGNELRVRSVLEGTVRRAGDRLRISIQLIDVASDELRWSQTYDRELRDVFRIQSDIAERVADALKVRLAPEERARIQARPTEDVRAYDLFLQGRHRWYRGTEADLRAAAELFQQAIALDPQYAPAYVGLADAYLGLCDEGCLDPKGAYEKIRPLVAKALELDDQLPEAHATMARLTQDYLWNWEEAGRRYQRAIELNPNWAVVCHSYAIHLALQGRFDQAIAEIRRAEELDPYSVGIRNCAAEIYRDAQDPEASIRECARMLEIDPGFVPAYTKLGKAYLQMGRLTEGVAAMERARELSRGGPLPMSYLAYAYGVAGRREEARRLIQDLERRAEERYLSPFNVAIAYAGLHDVDATLTWLSKAYQAKASTIADIKVNRIFDFLRSEPAFLELERSLGLTPPMGEPGRVLVEVPTRSDVSANSPT
jgi:adenylate cyclase